MAQQNIVSSLFGLTPEAYQQNRLAELQAQQVKAGTMAGTMLNPSLAPLYAQAAQQGQVIGEGVRAVAGLLGVEDPQLQAIKEASVLKNQFDITTSAGLKKLSQALMQRSQETGNNVLAGFAQQAAEQYNKTLLNEANVTAKTREQLPTIAKLQLYKDRLVAAGATPQQIAEVDAVIKAEGEGKGTKIVLPGEQQGKELRTANVKQYVDLGDRALTAGTTLQTVNDMNNLINKAFVGVGAGAKLNAAQVANALGVSVTGTTESEQLDQLFSALTIGQAKNLKGALSDKDVKFLKEAVGSRGLTKDTLAAVVNRISRDAQVDDLTYQKATEYKSSGGDLADFDFVKAKKEAMADINEKAAKQKRLEELRRKANQ